MWEVVDESEQPDSAVTACHSTVHPVTGGVCHACYLAQVRDAHQRQRREAMAAGGLGEGDRDGASPPAAADDAAPPAEDGSPPTPLSHPPSQPPAPAPPHPRAPPPKRHLPPPSPSPEGDRRHPELMEPSPPKRGRTTLTRHGLIPPSPGLPPMGGFALSVAAAQADGPESDTPPGRHRRGPSEYHCPFISSEAEEEEVDSPRNSISSHSEDELPSPTNGPIGTSDGGVRRTRRPTKQRKLE